MTNHEHAPRKPWPRIAQLLAWILTFELVSAMIGQAIRDDVAGWYATLAKPAMTPPNILFPIVWTCLYAMIAAAGWVVWRQRHTRLKIIFAVYALLNWGWSFAFFGAHLIGLGLAWIIAVDIAAAVFIWRAWGPARMAAILMIPPLIWTVYASWITYGVWVLNPGS